MAPKTPQANSKLPKPPMAGGAAIPLTGIPAPGNVLQRRSFMPSPAGSSVSKALKDMTPEQQALLAEAISIHSPGLIDPNRKPISQATSPAPISSSFGSGPGHGHLGAPAEYPSSPSISTPDRASPTSLASPLSYRAPASQLGRRHSNTRLGASPDTATSTPISAIAPLAGQQVPRPASFSGMSPLSTTSNSSHYSGATSPSPTTPGGSLSRPAAGSPSGSRPTIPTSRLSAPSGFGVSAGANTGAPSATGPGVGPHTGLVARSTLSKQPMLPRSPAAAASSPVKPGALAAIPGSPAIAPPSLDNYEVGDRVIVESMALSGYLRFVGPTEFKTGTWAGIELDTPTGKNDGSVGGVNYFQCRPKHGIFVLAAKVAKSELLFPSLPQAASPPSAVERPLSTQEETPASQPSPINHAAQAASRITAGSRASKYLGMTASQLKQRSTMPQPLTARTGPSHSQSPSTASTPGSSIRASSPTVRSLTGMSGSPTTPRTIQSGAASARANSPSPAPKPINRASSPTTRVTLGSRLSQSGAKPGLQSLQNRTAAHSRSTSTSSSVASQSSPSGPRVRTSPTPGRTNTASRRLSSRSETPDATNILSPSESHSNLLDQATAIQMGMAQDGAPSPSLDMFGKEHVREVADERVLQELEDLNLMKSVWEKERAAKDQEIQVMTEKMTQAWLEAARSQKEKTALLQEKEELAEKLKDLEENGRVSDNAESGYGSEAQQAVIELLQKDLQEATMRASTLEAEVQDVTARAIEDEVKATKEHEELRTAEESLHLEQLALLEQERELLDSKISDLEASSRATSETLGAQLKAALDEAAASKDRIEQLQGALDSEQSVGQQHATKSKERVETLENELHMSQEQHLKSEKLVRSLDEKVKEHETLLSKREQEIVGLKSELDEMTGMVQSEEVDRMRKVWELEKKRLEEAVAENITVMTSLRSEIQVLEMTEEELSDRVKSLEANTATLSEAKASCDAEIEHLQKEANNLQSVHEQEKESLKAKIAETEASVETRLAESNEAIEQLEIVAQSVDEWRERCEAMQLEMIQKTAKLEDIGFELADAQAQNETLKKKYEETIIELENKPSGPSAAQLVEIESVKAELAALLEEREQLKVKTSELEAALALSASSQSTSAPSNTGDAEVVRNREELEDEIANLKKMVHNLTKENVSVASINKKLMQEHDNLMEAHKHVETECLKLMDEVERLHTESLAMVSMEVPASVDKDETENGHRSIDSKEELKASLESRDAAAADKQNGQNSSSSVIRLEGLLKDKQAMLDRLTQTHALEMRELRQRYVELDRTKSWEVSQLNKELTELESLIESKIFHEADLEEEVQKKQKDIERLQAEISDLKSQLARAGGSSIGSYADLPPLNGSAIGLKGYGQGSRVEGRSRTVTNSTDKALFCEICEMEGHDLITCDAVFGSKSGANAGNTNLPPAFSTTEVDDDRPYCDNCEEFGDHYTDECPNESLTY